MGAVASVMNDKNKKKFPKNMTEEDTIKVVEDLNLGENTTRKLSKQFFKSFRGIDGVASGKIFESVMYNKVEQEVYRVFLNYALEDDGVLMDNAAFIMLLRDARILSKLDFTVHYANIMFSEHTTKLSPPKRLNFAYFRKEIVPILAGRKGLSVDDILKRISRLEYKDTEQELSKISRPGGSDEIEQKEAVEEVSRERRASEADEAAKKLQGLVRQKQADRKIEFMRQCSMERTDKNVAQKILHNKIQYDPGDEANLKDIFSRYVRSCATHYEFIRSFRSAEDMERVQFLTMCIDAKLIDGTTFTLVDCSEVYDRAIAIARNPKSDAQYNDDVFFGKRIGFLVFKDIVLPCLMEVTKLDRKDVLAKLRATPKKPMIKEKVKNLDETIHRANIIVNSDKAMNVFDNKPQ